MAIWEKVSNVVKKIFNKKYLKAEKRFSTKESLKSFYVPVILFDLVYRKDGNYYPKVFLENLIIAFFWRNTRNFSFQGFGSSS